MLVASSCSVCLLLVGVAYVLCMLYCMFKLNVVYSVVICPGFLFIGVAN